MTWTVPIIVAATVLSAPIDNVADVIKIDDKSL